MVPAEEAVQKLQEGAGFTRVDLIPGSTYRDNSTVLIVPTRGMIHHKTVACLQSLMAPMNQKRALIFAAGDEVGKAYDRLVANVLENPELNKWKYIMTIEDDNLVPQDAHIRLLESIEHGQKFDAVSGIYFTKGDYNMPMAYGDPEEYRRTNVIEFKPRDTRDALRNGHLMEVNGIAMGCGLWRMDLFRELPPPWFVTVADVIPDKGPMAMTQDLYFCKRAREAGKRFAVDFRVKVGHLDINSGQVF